MASKTLTSLSDRWADGTSLSIYPRSNFNSANPPTPGIAPVGSATATGPLSNGSITFAGLADNTEYVVTDAAGSKYVRVSTWGDTHGAQSRSEKGTPTGYPDAARLPFNARDYGAKGDGTTDDTAAIQAADAAAAASRGVVFFPPGTYKATDLFPSAGTTWRGDGATISFVDNGTSTSRSLRITTDDVTVTGLTLTSTATSRTGTFGLIRAQDCARLKVIGCTFLVSPSVAIHTINVADFLIQGNTIRSTMYADGIHVSRESRRGRIIGNQIESCQDDAIAVASYRTLSGVGSYQPCSDIVIEGNTIRDTLQQGRGICINGGRDVTVTGNTIRDTNAAGIIVSNLGLASGWASVGVTIQGNSIRNAGRSASGTTRQGIYVIDARAVSIGGNLIDQTGAEGITLATVSRDVLIEGNRISRTAGRGIVIPQVASTDATLRAELYTDQGETAPATAVSGNIAIVGNEIRAAASSDGMYVAGESGNKLTNLTVTGNVIVEQGSAGIRVDDVNQAAIGNNRVGGTGTTGIKLFRSRYATVMGNVVQGGVTTPIQFDTTTDSLIEGNVCPDGALSVAADCTGVQVRGNVGASLALRTVASAASIALAGSEGDVYAISGTTNIDTITATGMAGRVVTLKFAGVLTVGDGTGNLKLAGAFATTADDTLTLACDGTNWFEVARAVN